MSLRFRRDRTFTIAQFTDIHWVDGGDADSRTRALMEAVVEAEQPDLVMLTGDVLNGSHCADPAHAWREVVAPFEDRKQPWAAVFGNHDDEGSLNRRQLMDVQLSCASCVSQAGPENLNGVGNYALRIAASEDRSMAAVLYCLDSLAYAPDPPGGYDWIHRDQIDWFMEASRGIDTEFKRTRGVTTKIPALAFFHIPLPEYDEVWDHYPCRGSRFEPVCAPRLNSGFFLALHEAGDVMAAFVGHDHINDFEGDLHGIRLCYGRASGYNTYGREGFPRGARMIRLFEGERRFTTWLRLEGGAIVEDLPPHEPQGRVLSTGP